MTRGNMTSAYGGRNEVKFEGLNVEQTAASNLSIGLKKGMRRRADLWVSLVNPDGPNHLR
jgi:hypothetical protein